MHMTSVFKLFVSYKLTFTYDIVTNYAELWNEIEA